jgi:hypothetical protein
MPRGKLKSPPGVAASHSVTLRLDALGLARLKALIDDENERLTQQRLSARADRTSIIRIALECLATERGIDNAAIAARAEAIAHEKIEPDGEAPQRRTAPTPAPVASPAPAPVLAAPAAEEKPPAPPVKVTRKVKPAPLDEDDTDDGLDTASDAALKTRAFDLCRKHGRGAQVAFARAVGCDKRMVTEWFSGRRPCPAGDRAGVIRVLRTCKNRIA